MSTPLYVQHDWSAAAWATMLSCVILVVLGLFTLFIVMVHRSSQTTLRVPTTGSARRSSPSTASQSERRRTTAA